MTTISVTSDTCWRWRTRFDPTNPAPPVTTTFIHDSDRGDSPALPPTWTGARRRTYPVISRAGIWWHEVVDNRPTVMCRDRSRCRVGSDLDRQAFGFC